MKSITGTGSVYYNNSKNRWVGQYYLIEDGKKTKKSIYAKTRDEVNMRLQAIMYEFHNNSYIQDNGIPLSTILYEIRETKYNANRISDGHYARLKYVLKEIDNSSIGHMDITNITTRDLQNYFNTLTTRYSDSVIKKLWQCINQGFEYAIEENYITKNPMKRVIKPKSRLQTKDVNSITIEEQLKLYNYLRESNLSDEKYKNVILTQLYTGMRIGEVLALTEKDIDFTNKTISINKTVALDPNGNLTIKPGAKTIAGNRTIPLPSHIEYSLQEQIKNYEPNKYNLLFSVDCGIIRTSTINGVLKKICKKIDITPISTHVLRHTYGTRCLESGMSIVVISHLLGHTDISVTINTYTSVLNKFKNEEINKVTQLYLDNGMLAIDSNSIQLSPNDYSVQTPNLEYSYLESGIITDYSYIYNSSIIRESITQDDFDKFEKAFKKWKNKNNKAN